MKPAVIFDIDGTLADNSHRVHYIQGTPKNWHAYNANMHLDEPIEPTCRLLRACATRYDIILMTGREDQYQGVTEDWLREQWLPFMCLFMRPTGHHGPDHHMKLGWLARARSEGYEPFMVVEDRSQVVAMWRAAGLVCLQCAEGNY